MEIENKTPPIKTVCIPSCANHAGLYAVNVKLYWICPICGKPRGEPALALSYDGGLYLSVDHWTNPCGHIDYYADVRKEAAQNGLNNGGGRNV